MSNLDLELDTFEAASLSLLLALVNQSAAAGQAANAPLAMTAAIAEVREKIGTLRQTHRENIAADLKPPNIYSANKKPRPTGRGSERLRSLLSNAGAPARRTCS